VKKRIVIVGPAWPYRGGQALVESHLYETLSKLGYDCHTVSYSLLYPSILFPGTTQFDKSGVLHFDHRNRIYRLINSINPFSWIRAAWKIRDLKPDATVIIWWMGFFGPALATIAWFLKQWKTGKIVFLVENFISHEKRWFDNLSARRTMAYGDHYISESDYVTKQLVEAFPDRPVHKTTLPVYDCYATGDGSKESSRASLGITSKKVVLFFGYIRPYKGLDNLIRAFKDIQSQHPDTTLLIVGECYEDKSKYTDLIASEGLTESTVFVSEYVPNEDVERYFLAADVVCLPYNSATQSGIIMMAYGHRRPIVTTNVGGLAEFVREGKTGYIVPPGDLTQLAAAVNRVLTEGETVDFESHVAEFTGELGHKNLEKVFDAITG